MRFSAKSEYGVRALLDVAMNGGNKPIQVKEIAKRQGIPERFLEQVMSSLKKAGLVESVRGAQGGYMLGRPDKDITLADIIQAVEGPIALMECTSEDESRCEQVDLCVIRDAWRDVQSSIVEALDSVSLAQMAAKRRERESVRQMYHI